MLKVSSMHRMVPIVRLHKESCPARIWSNSVFDKRLLLKSRPPRNAALTLVQWLPLYTTVRCPASATPSGCYCTDSTISYQRKQVFLGSHMQLLQAANCVALRYYIHIRTKTALSSRIQDYSHLHAIKNQSQQKRGIRANILNTYSFQQASIDQVGTNTYVDCRRRLAGQQYGEFELRFVSSYKFHLKMCRTQSNIFPRCSVRVAVRTTLQWRALNHRCRLVYQKPTHRG